MKDQIERDSSSMENMPSLEYVVIVGWEQAKPNRVVVIVCDIVEAGPDSPIGIKIKIERWVPNEFVGTKAGGYEVFVIT